MSERITETDWEQSIVDLAHMLGYVVAAFRPARTEKGWRTPCKYDGEGFVDLALASEEKKRLLFVEVKSRTGKLTKGGYINRKGRLDYQMGQEDWLRVLKATGAECYVWKVGQITLEEIVRLLE